MVRPGLEPGTPRFSGTVNRRVEDAGLQGDAAERWQRDARGFLGIRVGLGHERHARGLNAGARSLAAGEGSRPVAVNEVRACCVARDSKCRRRCCLPSKQKRRGSQIVFRRTPAPRPRRASRRGGRRCLVACRSRSAGHVRELSFSDLSGGAAVFAAEMHGGCCEKVGTGVFPRKDAGEVRRPVRVGRGRPGPLRRPSASWCAARA
jgi:hypothetical protein